MQEGQNFGQAGDPQRRTAGEDMSGLGFSDRTGGASSEAEQRVDELRRSAAQTLDRGADRVEEWSDEQQGTMGRAARRTAEMMERGADAAGRYDADDVRRMIERQVRSNPLPSLLVALAAGWMVGRVLR